MGGAAKTVIADIKNGDTLGRMAPRVPVVGRVSAVNGGTGMDGSTEIQFQRIGSRGAGARGCAHATIITSSFLKERLWI